MMRDRFPDSTARGFFLSGGTQFFSFGVHFIFSRVGTTLGGVGCNESQIGLAPAAQIGHEQFPAHHENAAALRGGDNDSLAIYAVDCG